jgi:hypothetical protein
MHIAKADNTDLSDIRSGKTFKLPLTDRLETLRARGVLDAINGDCGLDKFSNWANWTEWGNAF